jgi:thiol-disulfide isomerase/thioredoxin
MLDFLPQTERARELYGDQWFNGEPVSLASLTGQVVLIEFWDYSCGPGVRTLPLIGQWARQYEAHGLRVVGVHTPRFPFGADPENVRRALDRLKVHVPVVMDNQSLIASQYGCRNIPEIVLVDKDGFIRYRWTGDGGLAEFELALQALLRNAGTFEEMPPLMNVLHDVEGRGAVRFRTTPEVFAGYLRGSLGNTNGYAPESVVEYDDPGVYFDGRFYLDGLWMNDRYCMRMEEESTRQGRLIVGYHGVDAEAVLAPEGSGTVLVTVRQDDGYLHDENKGADVRIDAAGRSYVSVDEPRLYHLVHNPEHGEHLVTLETDGGRISAYAFSFSSDALPAHALNN